MHTAQEGLLIGEIAAEIRQVLTIQIEHREKSEFENSI